MGVFAQELVDPQVGGPIYFLEFLVLVWVFQVSRIIHFAYPLVCFGISMILVGQPDDNLAVLVIEQNGVVLRDLRVAACPAGLVVAFPGYV
ncbi:hypothetical protein DSECCO2_489610 [anaerobic digester metagenome]